MEINVFLDNFRIKEEIKNKVKVYTAISKNKTKQSKKTKERKSEGVKVFPDL